MKPDVAARISILAKRLRTPSFRECGPLLREAREQGLDYETFLLLLLEQEARQRDEKARQKRLRAARFPLAKSLDEFDMSRLANVSEASLWDLASGDFVDRRQNVILVGNPDTGKTHLAIGLGRRLCEKGFSVRFTQAASLATELSEVSEDKVLGRLLKTLETVDLLILDELSYVSFTKSQSELLFHALSARNEKGSVMITTNLEFSKWTELFPDPMLAAAMIDRITHRSHILDMNGASYRLAETKRRKAKESGST
jgi:DNA replication protein DnaC